MAESVPGRYRAFLFGLFEIVGEGDVMASRAWRSQQNRTILKVLLLHRRHVVTADQILEVLWPDEAPEATRQRLYVRLSQLRRMLDPSRAQATITSIGGGYCLSPDPAWWVDVDAFEAAAAQGRGAQEAGDLDSAIAAYETARRLYRGDLLEEDRYADWAIPERERLLERYLVLLTELAEAYARQGRYRRAIACYRRVLDRDPCREAVFVRLMLTYAHAGEPAQALRTFERCRQVLAEELSVAPLPATEALAKRIRTGSLGSDGTAVTYPPPAYEGRLFEIPYSLARTPFVGREREYAWLIARWRARRPGLVLIEGAAGVGKTRLAAEALGFIAAQDGHILRTPPTAPGETASWTSLVTALRPLWQAQSGAAAALPGDRRDALRRLFESPAADPASAGPARMLRFGIEGTRPAPGDADLPRALAAWLDLVTTPTTVLFVDDAPRLDAGGLMLLATLARALTVIVTARADELPAEHPLRSTFYDLAAAGLADRLLLAPLTDDATAALIRCLAGVDLPTLSSQVTARAAGNPLFLIALLQALFEAGTLYIDAGDRWAYTGAALPLPPSVRELIEQRMQRLDQAQRSLLDAVAVIGQDFDFALLQRVVGMPEASLFATLDDLLSLGLVVEPRSGSRGEFAPAHALYVEAVRETLPGVRARHLHGRVADALLDLTPDAPSARVADHLYRAGRLPEAVAHAVGAGAWALDRYAVDAAVMHFAKAARWAEKAGDGAVTGELWLRFHAGWAEALRRSGRPQAAREHYERALPLATGTTKLHIVYQIAALETVAGAAPAVFSLRGEALAEELTEPWTRGPFRCSQAYWAALGGDPDRARLYAAEGLWCLRRVDAGDALPLWLRDRTHIIMARTHALWGEWAAARRYAALALAGNAARGDAYGVADAQVTLSQADHGLGRYAEAQVHAEQALVQADAAGDLRLAGKARYALAVARLAGEVTSDVGPQIARLLEIAEQTGDLEAYARGQLLRARVLRRSGAWEAALAVLQPLLAKARAVGVPLYAVMTLHQLAAVHLARGDRAAAQEMATEALALARRCRMRHEIAALTALLRDIRL